MFAAVLTVMKITLKNDGDGLQGESVGKRWENLGYASEWTHINRLCLDSYASPK